MSLYTHLTLEERENLYKWEKNGISMALIAEKLSRDRSSLYREKRRNKDPDDPEIGYLPDRHICLQKREGKQRVVVQSYHVTLS